MNTSNEGNTINIKWEKNMKIKIRRTVKMRQRTEHKERRDNKQGGVCDLNHVRRIEAKHKGKINDGKNI